MEQPLSLKAEEVRREKVRALRACQALAPGDCVRGQYDGYAEDSSITNKETTTETFAACKLFVDTPRWASVPFVLTAGKALQEKKLEVRILFRDAPCRVPELQNACRNELVVRVQPDERVYWRVANKVPGLEELQVEPRRMNLMYSSTEVRSMPDAYERLVLEVLRGDGTNFVGEAELDASWAVFSPALSALEGVLRSGTRTARRGRAWTGSTMLRSAPTACSRGGRAANVFVLKSPGLPGSVIKSLGRRVRVRVRHSAPPLAFLLWTVADSATNSFRLGDLRAGRRAGRPAGVVPSGSARSEATSSRSRSYAIMAGHRVTRRKPFL